MVDSIISGSDFVKINVTNSKTDHVAFEKKFPKDLTIADFKSKLEIITGGSAQTMQLELYNGSNLIGKLDNNDALLGSYPIQNGHRVHVVDNFTFIADHVQKFDLTKDQYEKKEDSVRNYLKKNRLGKYNEEEMKKLEEKRRSAMEAELERAKRCTIGSRCRITTRMNPTRLGTIRYNGELEDKRGIFIGVELDEPLGTNDGSVDGKRYFECKPKYGSFVFPSAVEIGDFQPEDDGLEDEVDEI